MNGIKNLFYLLPLALFLMACSSNDSPSPNDKPVVSGKKEIKINATAAGTRVSDISFDNGDRVGIFVVNYDGNTPGTLKLSGNHVDNMAFSFSGSWVAQSPVYWKDDDTHADFYLYYPYSASLTSVGQIPFQVKTDQSSEQGYKDSELLAGSVKNVAPTDREVNITARHLMSQICIFAEPGDGFKADDLAPGKIAIKINNVLTHASLDLAAATATATGETASIIPGPKDNYYRALLPPQSVEETNLITVTVDGRDFNLKKAFSFEAGKVHKFTVRLTKTSNGVNVNIAPWEDDGTDNGGVAE